MKFNDHYHIDFATQRVAITPREYSKLDKKSPAYYYESELAVIGDRWFELDYLDPLEVYPDDSAVLWFKSLASKILSIKEAQELMFYVSINELPSDILEKAVKSSHFKEAVSTSRKLDHAVESVTAAAFQAEIDLKKMDMPFDIDGFLDRVKTLYLSRNVLVKEYKL